MPPSTNPATTADALRTRLSRLHNFLELDPDNLNLLADVSDLALQCGDLPAVRTAVQHALALQPQNPYFALRLSSVAIAECNLDEALEVTESLLTAGYDAPAVRYNRAFALVSSSRFAEAKNLLTALYAEQAPYPLVVRLLIRTHHYLGEVEEAIAVARAHLESNPDSGDVAGMLSLLYFDSDDLAQASEWSQRALAAAPDNLDALLAAGGTALGAEDTEEAKAALHRAISVQPRSGRAWASLGLADLLEFNLDAAREKLTHAVKYMPEHIGTWHVLGWVHLLQGNGDAAEASFQQALAIDENFGETHGGLAAVAAARGNWEQAERHSKIARRLDPESMSAHYAQILRLQQEGKADAALRTIESALRQGKAPAGGSLLEMLGRVVGKYRR